MQDDMRIKDSEGLELSQEGDNCLDFRSDCRFWLYRVGKSNFNQRAA